MGKVVLNAHKCWLGPKPYLNLTFVFSKIVPAYLLFQSGPDTFFMKI